MPELPEVETVVRELNRKLKGKKIKKVEIFEPKILFLGTGSSRKKRIGGTAKAEKFTSLLLNKNFLKVYRRAKFLIFQTDSDVNLLVHLKMTGQFIFEDKKLFSKNRGLYRLLNSLSAPLIRLPSKHTHLVFTFFDGSKLFYNDVRKFGFLQLLNSRELVGEIENRKLGHEPLSKDFNLQKFILALQKKPKAKIKSALLDPSLVSGIGNIYSDEILFHSKIHPFRQVKSLSSEDFETLFKFTKKILSLGIKAKGSSVGDFIRTDGSWGKMGKYHFVYGKKGENCKRCGMRISSEKINGRTTSFCPRCQI